MNIQSLIVLGGTTVAILYFATRFMKNLAKKGQDAGCGCSSGSCCKTKRKA